MTGSEREWLECQYAYDMLEYLERKTTNRKFRLFACACGRKVWPLLVDERSKSAVEQGERFADGQVDAEALADVRGSAPHGQKSGGSWISWNKVRLSPRAQAERSALAAVGEIDSEAAWQAARESMALLQGEQCDLIRDIFGNPFRPSSLDANWRTEDVMAIAIEIYERRAFDRMADLGRALADAGCHDSEALAHCRPQVDHFLGCWLLDTILGKM